MPTARRKKDIEIPFLLSEAVKNGRAILFLGAGASKECKSPSGKKPPNADELRDILSQKYFNKLMPKRNVMSVAEMAINIGAGANLVAETIYEAFQGFEVSKAHRDLTEFNWRLIVTTNYDTYVESAYSDTKRRRQTLIPFVKDDEPVDERRRSAVNPLDYVKLHGCLNHRLDKDIPLVLSWEQYAVYSQNRCRLFSRLIDPAHECPVIFIGYSIGDSHIRELIYKLDQRARPRWYIVDPDAEEEDIRLWASRNIDVIKCRFGEFMEALLTIIPPLLRFLQPKTDNDALPIESHFSAPAEVSELLKNSLSKDLTYVHSLMPVAEQTAERFYSGYDTGWGCITNRLDARRKVTEDLLFKALLENEAPSDPVFLLLKGPAGAGKTIALKRAAYEAATANGVLVLWMNESGQLRPDVFIEIFDLCHQPMYLFVDEIAIHVDNIVAFIAVMKSRHIPLVLIGAEREADWTTYCSNLQSVLSPQSIRVGNLSTGEVELLLDLLERHNCLGDLKIRTRKEQIDAFQSQEHADRQLLVALHVLTRGIPFEKIVLNEYLSVSPDQARRLYLDIASLNQFGVPVRAGTISRISGIDFNEYEKAFFAPLKDMVSLGRDNYSGDMTYRTRHVHVAQILFKQVFDNDDDKLDQFLRVINGIDVGFQSDARVLEGICKGRVLADTFSVADNARSIFQEAVRVAPKQAYLHQQWAIFESNHDEGDYLEAEFRAETASWMQPKNTSFKHTQAEVARKRANVESSPVLREQLRRKTRTLLEEMPKNDRFRVSSRCKLLVDEMRDLTDKPGVSKYDTEDEQLTEKLKDTETALERAQREFPDDAEMFEIEARLWSDLKDSERALKALESAWKKSPRGTGTAVRLGRLYGAMGRSDDRVKVLQQAVRREPDDRASHFGLATYFIEQGKDNFNDAEHHLVRCIAIDQKDFESHYLYGQVLFAKGDIEKSKDVFANIHRNAPDNFRRTAPGKESVLTAILPSYIGSLDAIRENYVLIRSGAYPEKIYARNSSLSDKDEFEIGVEVSFRIRFSRRGPVGMNVMLRRREDDRSG